jgi:CheY-like chemotaxis protein
MSAIGKWCMPKKPKKILVVEDDKLTQTLICDILKSAGYQVVTANDAATTVKMVQEEEPDLITLDVVLASESPTDCMDGFKVATWLKRLHPEKENIIIIISGVDPDKVIQGASAVNAYTFLPKPIEKAKLLATVAAALED